MRELDAQALALGEGYCLGLAKTSRKPRENLAKTSRKPRENLAKTSRKAHALRATRSSVAISGSIMTRTTLSARFLAGWEPAQLPPRGPDGMVPAEPPKSLPVLPPSLCEAGPCRHYHRIASVMDAAQPLAGGGGTHAQVTRACYPSPGVEIELGEETPVLQCSRWEPDNEQERLHGQRSAFLRGPAGKEFTDLLAAFEDRESSSDIVGGRTP